MSYLGRTTMRRSIRRDRIPEHGDGPRGGDPRHTDIAKAKALVENGTLRAGIHPDGDPVVIGPVAAPTEQHRGGPLPLVIGMGEEGVEICRPLARTEA